MKPYLLLTALSLAGLGAHADITTRGSGLAYDSQLNVTWVTDAALMQSFAAELGSADALFDDIRQNVYYVWEKTSWYSLPIRDPATNQFRSGYFLDYRTDASGSVHAYRDFSATGADHNILSANWYGATAFVQYLNNHHYQGYSDWRLPKMLDASCAGLITVLSACPEAPGANEVQSLFYSVGWDGDSILLSHHNAAYNLFRGLRNYEQYWLSDENEAYESVEFPGSLSVQPGGYRNAGATVGGIDNNTSINMDKRNNFYSLMVLRDGDVVTANPPAVPEPATGVLALLGLGVVLWRRRDVRV